MTSTENNNPTSQFITVHALLLCFGELAIEAGLFNSALSRTGGDSEVEEKEMFCHFSLMIQLLALGNDRRKVDLTHRELSINDLMMLAEDEWLKTVPTTGLRYIKNLFKKFIYSSFLLSTFIFDSSSS